jgi:hypothetical protein
MSQVKSTLYSSVTDTYGYIGVHNNSKTIIVAFQGLYTGPPHPITI